MYQDPELQKEFEAALARNERLLHLFEHNGYRPKIVEMQGGWWFETPPELVEIAGFQMGRLP